MISDELTIKRYAFSSVTEPEATVLLVHGIGEHCGRYTDWVKLFNESGIEVRMFDLPGHGESGGKRGVMPDFGKIYDIIDYELSSINSDYPGKPVFLYGHSLGGTLVLGYLLERKKIVNGAIITSPWLRLSMKPSGFRVFISELLGKIAPDITIRSGLNPGYLSHNAEVVRAYKADPMVHDLISPRLFCNAQTTASEILAYSAMIEVPLLLVHGRDDMITSPSGSVEVASNAPKAMLKLWDGAYHELHNESLRIDHFELIREWIDTLI